MSRKVQVNSRIGRNAKNQPEGFVHWGIDVKPVLQAKIEHSNRFQMGTDQNARNQNSQGRLRTRNYPPAPDKGVDEQNVRPPGDAVKRDPDGNEAEEQARLAGDERGKPNPAIPWEASVHVRTLISLSACSHSTHRLPSGKPILPSALPSAQAQCAGLPLRVPRYSHPAMQTQFFSASVRSSPRQLPATRVGVWRCLGGFLIGLWPAAVRAGEEAELQASILRVKPAVVLISSDVEADVDVNCGPDRSSG